MSSLACWLGGLGGVLALAKRHTGTCRPGELVTPAAAPLAAQLRDFPWSDKPVRTWKSLPSALLNPGSLAPEDPCRGSFTTTLPCSATRCRRGRAMIAFAWGSCAESSASRAPFAPAGPACAATQVWFLPHTHLSHSLSAVSGPLPCPRPSCRDLTPAAGSRAETHGTGPGCSCLHLALCRPHSVTPSLLPAHPPLAFPVTRFFAPFPPALPPFSRAFHSLEQVKLPAGAHPILFLAWVS